MRQPPSIAVVLWTNRTLAEAPDLPTGLTAQTVRPREVLRAAPAGGRALPDAVTGSLARDYDILAFTSDRMQLRADWLEWLLRTFADSSATAVGGPVICSAIGGSPGDVPGPSLLLADGRSMPAFVTPTSSPVLVDILSPENMAIRLADLRPHDLALLRSAPGVTALVLRLHKLGLTAVCAPEAAAALEASDLPDAAGFETPWDRRRVRAHVELLVSGLGAGDRHVRRYGATVLRYGSHEVLGALRGYRTRSPRRTLSRLAAASVRTMRALRGYVEALMVALSRVRRVDAPR